MWMFISVKTVSKRWNKIIWIIPWAGRHLKQVGCSKMVWEYCLSFDISDNKKSVLCLQTPKYPYPIYFWNKQSQCKVATLLNSQVEGRQGESLGTRIREETPISYFPDQWVQARIFAHHIRPYTPWRPSWFDIQLSALTLSLPLYLSVSLSQSLSLSLPHMWYCSALTLFSLSDFFSNIDGHACYCISLYWLLSCAFFFLYLTWLIIHWTRLTG